MLKKIKNSLSAKVFLWIAGLLILCSLLIYGIVMLFLPQSYTVVATDRVLEQIVQLEEELSDIAYADAQTVIDEFCRKNQALATLTDGIENAAFGYADKKHMLQAEVMTSALEVVFKDRYGSFTLSITAPVSAGNELTKAFFELLPLLLAVILAISSAGAFLCSRILVKPILEISRISKRMADLDMTWECKVDRTDEMGVLAYSLNIMAKRLDAVMKELEQANSKLKEDMKKMTELSKQRRDFFAAASHELKTPITIIKGQVESMIFGIGSYKNTQKALPETLKEIENMESLVKEILTISKIEMKEAAGKSETVSVSHIISKVSENLLPLILDRDIKYHTEIPRDIAILGNSFLLEKAIHNIVNNAVRHSPEGAEVSVRLSERRLIVANTDTVIPEEELPTLFTPFYRVDKSRNKATGGSGLGLYLVKTILELHELKYRIENIENSVVFTVEL